MDNMEDIIITEYKKNMWPVYLSLLTVFISFGCVIEIFPFLTWISNFRPTILLMLLTLVASIVTRRLTMREFIGMPESKIVLFFVILGLVTVPFSVWPGGALQFWQRKMLPICLTYFCCIGNIKNSKEINMFHWVLILCGFFFGIGIIFFPQITPGGRYSTTTSYDANDMGLILVTLLPITLSLLFKVKNIFVKFFLLIDIGLLVFGILKTASRGALIGLIIVCIGIVVIPLGKLKFYKKFLIILLLLVISVVSSPDVLVERFSTFLAGEDYNLASTEETESQAGRLEMWQKGLSLLCSPRIITGVGIYQFGTALGNKYGKYFFLTAHNTYVQVFVELGIFGLLLYFATIVKILTNVKLINVYKNENEIDTVLSRTLRIAMVGFITASMFLSFAYSTLNVLLLVYSVGIKNTIQSCISDKDVTINE